MCKRLSICSALVTLVVGSVNAQQQEAVLEKVKFPNVGFDMVVATAQPGGPAFDLRGQPDPTIAYLAGGELVLSIDDRVLKMVKDIGTLQKPSCSFDAGNGDGNSPMRVAVYVVANGETRIARHPDAAPQVETLPMYLTRMELPAAKFDIVFGLTRFPDSGKLVFKHDREADAALPAILAQRIPSCVTHVAQDNGTADVITVYVVPKEQQLGPPTR